MKKRSPFLIIVFAIAASCTKTEVNFADNSQGNDPSVSYYDNYAVNISTYKLDSFITSNHSILTVGHHVDAEFGTIHGSSYAELVLAAVNDVKDQDVSFDSLVLVLKPNGKYYGDTSLPFNIRVNRLQENIVNEEESNINFSNIRKFSYDPSPVGQSTQQVRPLRGTEVRVRLSDVLGAELLQKLKTNATDIRTQSDFRKYFKGIRLSSDSTISKALYYFNFTADTLVRLYYKVNDIYPKQKTYNFSFKKETQFNNLATHHTNTALSVFLPNKKQVKNSQLTANRSFLHNNMGAYIKVNFPALQSLKESHPYVRIMRAELVVRPRPGSYAYPYALPEKIKLYSTDVNNGLLVEITQGENLPAQDGNLEIDHLYGDKTHYSFDITGFIVSLMNEGKFSSLALMVVPYDESADTGITRLVINDQQLNNGIQLKLYVLGL